VPFNYRGFVMHAALLYAYFRNLSVRLIVSKIGMFFCLVYYKMLFFLICF